MRLGVAALLMTTGSLAAAGAQLLPVDEASRRPDFFSFRAGVQRAIAQRDPAALLAIVHPQIRNSFGDDDGIDTFRRMWIDTPESGIWNELGTVLALGGSFHDDDTFVAPYVYSKWPDPFDAFEHVAVIGADVRVRAKPSVDAPALSSVSFVILPVAAPADTADWRAVRLDGGGTGYVASRYARSPVDYRAVFRFASGQWKMVTFVAGD